MLFNILISCGMIVVTTVFHSWATVAVMRWLRSRQVKLVATQSTMIRSLHVAVVALIVFGATLVESGAWAVVYVWHGAQADFETCLYFSMVTYTTLGYGDVVIEGEDRVMASFQAANGVIMFGWSTALLVAGLSSVSNSFRRSTDGV